jgi:hypothetical protein
MSVTTARKRATTGVLLLVLSGAAVGAWLLNPQPTDQEVLEEVVAVAEQSFETKSLSKILNHVASDYHDEGGLSRADVVNLAQRVVRSTEHIDITINDYDIQVRAPAATGHFDVVVAFHEGGGSVITLRRHLDVTFEKRRQGWRSLWRGRWLVTSVNGHGLDKDYESLF